MDRCAHGLLVLFFLYMLTREKCPNFFFGPLQLIQQKAEDGLLLRRSLRHHFCDRDIASETYDSPSLVLDIDNFWKISDRFLLDGV